MPLYPTPGAGTGDMLASNNLSELASRPNSRRNLGVASPLGMSDIAHPWYFAHRGASIVYPEDTIEAFRLAVATGAKFIEPDVHLLADGSIGVMHDDTVDRTTSSAGDVADQTALSWRNLVIDQNVPSILGTVRPPLLVDLFREFGNRVVIVPEAKESGAGAAITDLALQHGITRDFLLVQSFIEAELVAPKAAGYTTMLLSEAPVAATIAAAGWNWVGTSYTIAQATIDACIAAGLKVALYTPTRQAHMTAALATGAHGFFTDDILYSTSTFPRLLSDPFSLQAPYYGAISPLSTLYKGEYVAPASLRLVSDAGLVTQGCLQGWCAPLPTTVTISGSIKFNSAVNTTRWAGIFVGTSDRAFTDLSATGVNGYHALIRKNGTVQLYVVVNGVGNSLGSTTGTSIADGATITFTLEITPSAVTISRTDVSTVYTSSDTTYRPLTHLSLNVNGASIEYSGVSVSA